MDRNSIIGLLLIGGILIAWMTLSQPSKEELAKQRAKFVQDSTADYVKTNATALAKEAAAKRVIAEDTITALSDSAKAALKVQEFGAFSESSSGVNKIVTIENELMKVNVSAKGGRIASVELKNYKTFDQQPLMLFNADSSEQNIIIPAGNKQFNTD